MKIDLDAARAARGETTGEGPTVTFGGQEFQLPPEVPFGIAEGLAQLSEAKEDPNDLAKMGAGVLKVLSSLFGDAYEAFMATRPSIGDLSALVDGLAKAYGLEDLGESAASGE